MITEFRPFDKELAVHGRPFGQMDGQKVNVANWTGPETGLIIGRPVKWGLTSNSVRKWKPDGTHVPAVSGELPKPECNLVMWPLVLRFPPEKSLYVGDNIRKAVQIKDGVVVMWENRTVIIDDNTASLRGWELDAPEPLSAVEITPITPSQAEPKQVKPLTTEITPAEFRELLKKYPPGNGYSETGSLRMIVNHAIKQMLETRGSEILDYYEAKGLLEPAV